MDYTLMTRIESHANDLFKLGQDGQEETLSPLPRPSLSLQNKKKKIVEKIVAQDDTNVYDLIPSPSKKQGFSKSKSVPFSLSTIAEGDGDTEASTAQVSEVKKQPIRTKLFPFDSFLEKHRRLPKEEQQRIHYEDLFGCFTRNFGKGFVVGFLGRTSLNFFSELLHVIRTRSHVKRLLSMDVLLDGSKDHGLFLALLLSVHNSFMFVSKSNDDDNDVKRKASPYRAMVAGFLSGLCSFAFLPRPIRRQVLLFSSVRALEILLRIGAKRKRVPTIENGDTALMSLASGVMIYIWIFHPGNLDRAYEFFLQRQVNVPHEQVRAIASMQSGLPLQHLQSLNEKRRLLSLEPIPSALDYDTMADRAGLAVHPGQSLLGFSWRYFLKAFQTAAPVYFPVYFLPLVVFSRARLIHNPVQTLKTALSGAIRSSIFLATYCWLGIGSLSVGRSLGLRFDVAGQFAHVLPFISGMVAGLSTLLEKKQRRIELALYVLSKAIEGAHAVLKKKWNWQQSPQHADALAFAVTFAIVCHANFRHPELIRTSYRALLLRFFDTDERHNFF